MGGVEYELSQARSHLFSFLSLQVDRIMLASADGKWPSHVGISSDSSSGYIFPQNLIYKYKASRLFAYESIAIA